MDFIEAANMVKEIGGVVILVNNEPETLLSDTDEARLTCLVELFMEDPTYRPYADLMSKMYCEAVEYGIFDEMQRLLMEMGKKFIAAREAKNRNRTKH